MKPSLNQKKRDLRLLSNNKAVSQIKNLIIWDEVLLLWQLRARNLPLMCLKNILTLWIWDWKWKLGAFFNLLFSIKIAISLCHCWCTRTQINSLEGRITHTLKRYLERGLTLQIHTHVPTLHIKRSVLCGSIICNCGRLCYLFKYSLHHSIRLITISLRPSQVERRLSSLLYCCQAYPCDLLRLIECEWKGHIPHSSRNDETLSVSTIAPFALQKAMHASDKGCSFNLRLWMTKS